MSRPMLDLFDMPEPTGPDLQIRPFKWDDRRYVWRCPHCNKEVHAERETPATIAADPSCCYCRAESKGMTFSAWRRLPMEERLATKPADDFRSKNWRLEATT